MPAAPLPAGHVSNALTPRASQRAGGRGEEERRGAGSPQLKPAARAHARTGTQRPELNRVPISPGLHALLLPPLLLLHFLEVIYLRNDGAQPHAGKRSMTSVGSIDRRVGG